MLPTVLRHWWGFFVGHQAKSQPNTVPRGADRAQASTTRMSTAMGCSSTGRAAVSKTAGCRFEPCHLCNHQNKRSSAASAAGSAPFLRPAGQHTTATPPPTRTEPQRERRPQAQHTRRRVGEPCRPRPPREAALACGPRTRTADHQHLNDEDAHERRHQRTPHPLQPLARTHRLRHTRRATVRMATACTSATHRRSRSRIRRTRGPNMNSCDNCGANYPSPLAADRCCTDKPRPWDDERWWG